MKSFWSNELFNSFTLKSFIIVTEYGRFQDEFLLDLKLIRLRFLIWEDFIDGDDNLDDRDDTVVNNIGFLSDCLKNVSINNE